MSGRGTPGNPADGDWLDEVGTASWQLNAALIPFAACSAGMALLPASLDQTAVPPLIFIPWGLSLVASALFSAQLLVVVLAPAARWLARVWPS